MRIRLKVDIVLTEYNNRLLKRGREFDTVLNHSGPHNGLYTVHVDGRPADLLPDEIEIVTPTP